MAILWTVFKGADLRAVEDVETAMEGARDRLRLISRELLGVFRGELSHALDLLDLPEFYKLQAVLTNGDRIEQSVDSFMYARCACILSGRKAFEDAVIRREFGKYLNVFLQGAEGIIYLADDVAERRLDDDTLMSGFEQGSLDIGDNLSTG